MILDAVTAHKVAKALDRTMRKRGAIGSWSIHQPMRNFSAYFKGGITKFISARFRAFVGPAPRPSLPRGEPALLVSQAISGRKGVVSQD